MRPELSVSEELAMTTTPHPDSDRRAALRTQWLQRAADAFDRMFGATEQDLLVTFDQREQRACLVGDDLALWLLQQHLNADPLAQPALTQPPACPKCGKPAQPIPLDPDQPLPRRALTTRTGSISLQRSQWRCATCRVAFFPSG